MVTPIALRGVAVLVPVVTPAGFTIITPTNAGVVVGQVFASNSPTLWAITGDSNGLTIFLTDGTGINNLTDANGIPLTAN